jgi:hypothetical protein
VVGWGEVALSAHSKVQAARDVRETGREMRAARSPWMELWVGWWPLYICLESVGDQRIACGHETGMTSEAQKQWPLGQTANCQEHAWARTDAFSECLNFT